MHPYGQAAPDAHVQYTYHQQAAQPAPIPGYSIAPPGCPPRPGEVIIGWEVLPIDEGCSCDLNAAGLVTLVVLILVFWPLFWIPMVTSSCKNQRQRPIYGPPGSAMPPSAVAIPIPTAAPAQPVAGYPAPGFAPPAHAAGPAAAPAGTSGAMPPPKTV